MDTNYTALEINEVYPEDSGTYTCIAKNLGGETRTSCLLTVEVSNLSCYEVCLVTHSSVQKDAQQLPGFCGTEVPLKHGKLTQAARH